MSEAYFVYSCLMMRFMVWCHNAVFRLNIYLFRKSSCLLKPEYVLYILHWYCVIIAESLV